MHKRRAGKGNEWSERQHSGSEPPGRTLMNETLLTLLKNRNFSSTAECQDKKSVLEEPKRGI